MCANCCNIQISLKMTLPIDTNQIPLSHTENWYAQTLATIGGVNLRFRVMRDSAAKFHCHLETPECFFVLTGTVQIETETDSIVLTPGHFYEIKAGISHRAKVEGQATLIVFDQIEG